jgi:hypothetical protein
MSEINITGLNKAAVLAALYNASRPQGMGFLQYTPEPMTIEQAEALLDSGQTYFDYLQGRVMKVDLSNDDSFNDRLYDRDNGEGAAAIAIASLRATENPDNKIVQAIHREGRADAATIARDLMGQRTRFDDSGAVTTATLGLSDVADSLAPAVDRALSE